MSLPASRVVECYKVPRRPRRSRLGGSRGVPVLELVPVRASPVPRVVRGSFVVKFFFACNSFIRRFRGSRGVPVLVPVRASRSPCPVLINAILLFFCSRATGASLLDRGL